MILDCRWRIGNGKPLSRRMGAPRFTYSGKEEKQVTRHERPFVGMRGRIANQSRQLAAMQPHDGLAYRTESPKQVSRFSATRRVQPGGAEPVRGLHPSYPNLRPEVSPRRACPDVLAKEGQSRVPLDRDLQQKNGGGEKMQKKPVSDLITIFYWLWGVSRSPIFTVFYLYSVRKMSPF